MNKISSAEAARVKALDSRELKFKIPPPIQIKRNFALAARRGESATRGVHVVR